jgi:hypothetical protein
LGLITLRWAWSCPHIAGHWHFVFSTVLHVCFSFFVHFGFGFSTVLKFFWYVLFFLTFPFSVCKFSISTFFLLLSSLFLFYFFFIFSCFF